MPYRSDHRPPPEMDAGSESRVQKNLRMEIPARGGGSVQRIVGTLILRGEFTDSHYSIFRTFDNAKQHFLLPKLEIAFRAASLFQRGLHLKMSWTSEWLVADVPIFLWVCSTRKLPDHRISEEKHGSRCGVHIAERFPSATAAREPSSNEAREHRISPSRRKRKGWRLLAAGSGLAALSLLLFLMWC